MGAADDQRAQGARLEPGRRGTGDAGARAEGSSPAIESLLRQWKRWESGEVEPDRGKAKPFYKPIIAATFGTVTHAMFPVAPAA